VILVVLPATGHPGLAAAVAPYLTDGQAVFLPPGTLGTIVFALAARACGNDAAVSYAETGTLPYLVRKHGRAAITISAYAERLPTGVFPSKRSGWALAQLSQLYPAIEPVSDVMSAALMNAGPIIHPPLIIMNAGPLEHLPAWDIHNEGTQPSIRRVTDALDHERIAVREALGYAPPHFPLSDHYATAGDIWMYGRGAHDRLTGSGDWREKIDLIHHRYMQEDSALGLSLLTSIGRWAGCPTLVASGLLALASAIAGDRIDVTGRTLESLNLAGLSRDAMAGLLADGY
jgi:opine dehydrogenase